MLWLLQVLKYIAVAAEGPEIYFCGIYRNGGLELWLLQDVKSKDCGGLG